MNGTYATAFKTMSVVDGITGTGTDSTFSYPHTAMGGWLCAYTATNGVCGGTNPMLNNTPAEGEFYYSKVSANPLNVYRVDQCNGSEGVNDGVVPANLYGLGACTTGRTVIDTDMKNNCVRQTH